MSTGLIQDYLKTILVASCVGLVCCLAAIVSNEQRLRRIEATQEHVLHEIRQLDEQVELAISAKVLKSLVEAEMPSAPVRHETGVDKRVIQTLETIPNPEPVPETPVGWVYDGDGPRPVDMPPRIGNREFDNGPDFGNGSWAMKDEDGVWRRYGG